MSLIEWYGEREILITGATSQLGRNLIEKLLRIFPDVKVHVVTRTREGYSQTDRIKTKIFKSPGFERLRQKRPDAASRISVYEGNLVYDELGLTSTAQKTIAESCSIAFHCGGSAVKLVEWCRVLSKMRAIVVVTELFKCKEDQATEVSFDDVSLLGQDLPLSIVRIPPVGPAYREPMPGYVELLKGPTAFMVGVGYVKGKSDLPVEIIPVDIATNTLIVTCWDVGHRNNIKELAIYNASTIDSTWGDIIQKGNKANQNFRFPAFRVRGITSSSFVHWIVVFLLEWLPSFICDTTLYLLGLKQRMLAVHTKARRILKAFEPTVSRKLMVQRQKIYELEKCLSLDDKEKFPLRAVEIDLEAYILCSAAAVRKYCVNDANLKIITWFLPVIMVIFLCSCAYYYCSKI